MAYNGSGTFVINSTGQPVAANTVISSTVFNALTADLATGLSNSITKDGQQTVTANIPFNSNKITGLGAATTSGDALSWVTGTWTPADASGASLTFTSVSAGYTRVGNLVTIYAQLTYPSTADGSASVISGLPVAVANQNYASGCTGFVQPNTYLGGIINVQAVKNTSTIAMFITNASSIAAAPNSQFSGHTVNFALTYPVS